MHFFEKWVCKIEKVGYYAKIDKKIKIKIARASVNELKIDFTAKCVFNLNGPVNYYKDNVPFCYALPHFNLPKIKEFPPTCCLKWHRFLIN